MRGRRVMEEGRMELRKVEMGIWEGGGRGGLKLGSDKLVGIGRI